MRFGTVEEGALRAWETMCAEIEPSKTEGGVCLCAESGDQLIDRACVCARDLSPLLFEYSTPTYGVLHSS